MLIRNPVQPSTSPCKRRWVTTSQPPNRYPIRPQRSNIAPATHSSSELLWSNGITLSTISPIWIDYVPFIFIICHLSFLLKFSKFAERSPRKGAEVGKSLSEGTRWESPVAFAGAFLKRNLRHDDMTSYYRGVKTEKTSQTIPSTPKPLSYRGAKHTGEARKDSKMSKGSYRGVNWQ